jgi:hypothetical protein
MRHLGVVVGLFLILAGEPALAFSASVTEVDYLELHGYSPFTLTLTNVPPLATDPADLMISISGDFDFSSEFVTVSVEGIDLGPFLDSDPTNDRFDNASFGDVGGQGLTGGTASALLTLAEMALIQADGQILVTLQVSPASGNSPPFQEAVSLSISSVPEPSTALLLASGLAALVVRRRGLFAFINARVPGGRRLL